MSLLWALTPPLRLPLPPLRHSKSRTRIRHHRDIESDAKCIPGSAVHTPRTIHTYNYQFRFLGSRALETFQSLSQG